MTRHLVIAFAVATLVWLLYGSSKKPGTRRDTKPDIPSKQPDSAPIQKNGTFYGTSVLTLDTRLAPRRHAKARIWPAPALPSVLMLLIGTATLLLVACVSRADAATITIDGNCQSTHNISVSQNGQVLEDLVLLNARESAVLIDGYQNVTIRNVTIRNFDCDGGGDQYEAGIACWRCGGLTVENVTIEKAAAPRNAGGGNGIWVKNSTGGNTVRNNSISGGYDAIGGEDEFSSSGSFNRNSLIENNTIRNCSDDGIQSEGGNDGVAIRSNDISGCLIGIAWAPNLRGTLSIEDNVIHDLLPKDGEPSCYKIGGGGTGVTLLNRNVCDTRGNGLAQYGGNNPGNITARDNCFDVTRYVIETFDSGNLNLDRDRMWSSDGSRFVKWQGTQYGSLAAFRNATGQEPNGVQAQGCAAGPSPTPTPAVTPTPTLSPSPEPSQTPSATPQPTSTPTTTPTPTPTPTPQPTPTTACQVRVRVNQQAQWLGCTAFFEDYGP